MTAPTEPAPAQPAPPPVETQSIVVEVNPDPMMSQIIERSDHIDNLGQVGHPRRTVTVPPLGLAWDFPDETRPLPAGITPDRDARPSLDTVLELRRDRMATAREVVVGLGDESLDTETKPVEAAESRSYPVRKVCSTCSTRSGSTGSTRNRTWMGCRRADTRDPGKFPVKPKAYPEWYGQAFAAR